MKNIEFKYTFNSLYEAISWTKRKNDHVAKRDGLVPNVSGSFDEGILLSIVGGLAKGSHIILPCGNGEHWLSVKLHVTEVDEFVEITYYQLAYANKNNLDPKQVSNVVEHFWMSSSELYTALNS